MQAGGGMLWMAQTFDVTKVDLAALEARIQDMLWRSCE